MYIYMATRLAGMCPASEVFGASGEAYWLHYKNKLIEEKYFLDKAQLVLNELLYEIIEEKRLRSKK